MKSQSVLLDALATYNRNLGEIRERLDAVQVWIDAANFVQCPDLFTAQVHERDDLRRREKEMEFRIRFVKWILETDKSNETKE